MSLKFIMDASKIANNLVKNVSTGEMVRIGTFWENQVCVIHFLRRFGWPLCRLGAKQLSAIKPQLDANNVRLVGVGVEELGVEEFVQGNYWAGELYIDQKKSSYKALGFRQLGFLATAGALMSKKLRSAYSKATAAGITGNYKGDGFQNGGTIVVDKEGKVLYEYKQIDPSDHVDPEDILKALNIKTGSDETKTGGEVAEGSDQKNVECDDVECKLK